LDRKSECETEEDIGEVRRQQRAQVERAEFDMKKIVFRIMLILDRI
jgi:hypothetical protein